MYTLATILCFSGFLQAHVSYLDDNSQTCMLLLSVDRDSFFTLSECKNKIKEVGLAADGCNFPKGTNILLDSNYQYRNLTIQTM